MLFRKLTAELLGTALLVFFAVGTATLAFGFKFHGGSIAAGVVMTSLAFGLVLLALAYAMRLLVVAHVSSSRALISSFASRSSIWVRSAWLRARSRASISASLASRVQPSSCRSAPRTRYTYG